jgi:hypothetical protein
MDSKHWDWGKGYCRKHLGNGVPCRVCIETEDPDLERTAEDWERLAGSIAVGGRDETLEHLYDTDREAWAELVRVSIEKSLPESHRAIDLSAIRPVGEPLKRRLVSDQPSVQNLPKGIFTIASYDAAGRLVSTLRGENVIVGEGFERLMEADFSNLPASHYSGEGRLYSEVRFNEPLPLKSGDTLLMSYTMKAEDPNIETRIQPLPLAERLQLVADQHRQAFAEAGVADPDDLLKLLGAAELLQPTIPGFELPKRLPSQVPLDLELIGTISEAEGHSEELRAALMSQIAIYGEPVIRGLLLQAGIDEQFVDSLTSNRP